MCICCHSNNFVECEIIGWQTSKKCLLSFAFCLVMRSNEFSGLRMQDYSMEMGHKHNYPLFRKYCSWVNHYKYVTMQIFEVVSECVTYTESVWVPHSVIGCVLPSNPMDYSAFIMQVMQSKKTAWPWRWRHSDSLKCQELLTQCHIPEDLNLLQHLCDNLKCCSVYLLDEFFITTKWNRNRIKRYSYIVLPSITISLLHIWELHNNRMIFTKIVTANQAWIINRQLLYTY
jgi:hypothetical protein